MIPLQFDFAVDRAAKKVHIKKEFAATLDQVWSAFTTQKLLDQWTAPLPFSAKTKHMNFEVGGSRFYAMINPEGQAKWCIQKYGAINPKSSFTMWNAFADENEIPEQFGSDWEYSFSEKNGITTVAITIFNESFERMERVMEGFQQGFTMSLENLEKLLISNP